MFPMIRRAWGAAVLVASLALPSSLAGQRALVYCPVGIDATGCNAVVTALTGAGYLAVDRGWDGTGGTVDLRATDLAAYRVIVVPSLADDGTVAPYALLRDAAAMTHLRAAVIGGIAVYSGTPDQGSANRTEKDALIRNLAAWAGADHATAGGPGLVALLDASADPAARYDWLRAISPVAVSSDPAVMVYGTVRTLTQRGDSVLSVLGSPLAYSGMAMYGLMLPSGSPGVSLDAVGQTGTSTGGQVVLLTLAAGNTSTAVVATDKDDYPPGETVTITGAGWQPGETVSLTLHEDPLQHADRVLTAVADENGGFVNTEFAPEEHDLGVRFVLTAVGQSSGHRAQTTFTDGQPQDVTLSPTSVTVVAGVSAEYSVDVNMVGNSNACTVTLEVTSTLPLGVSASFNNNPVVLAAGSGNVDFTRTLTMATTAATPGGSHSFTVRATRGAGCQGSGAGPTTIGTLVVQAPVATTLSVAAPTPSSVTYGSAGPITLSATLTRTTGGAAVSGATVSFTVDASPVGSAVTNASGVATLATYNPSALNAGPHTVEAFFAGATISSVTYGASTSGTQTLTVLQAPQAITFTSTAPVDAVVGGPTYLVTAVGGGSGNPVSFSSGTPLTCSVSGSTVSMLAAGSCTVLANQAGNLNYSAAPQASQSFTIAKATPTIVWANPAAIVYGTALSGTQLNAVASVAGSYLYTPASGMVLDAGTHTLRVDFTPSDTDNYTTAFAEVSLTVLQATPGVSVTGGTFTYDATPKAATGFAYGIGGVGDVLSPAVTFSYVGIGATSYGPTATAPTAAGTYKATATFAGNTNYTGASADADLTIEKRAATWLTDPGTKVYGDPDPSPLTTGSGDFIASDGVTATYARAAGETVGTYPITATLSAAVAGALDNYLITNAGANFEITRRPASVTPDPASKVYGDPDPAAFTGTLSGFLAGDGVTATYARSPGETVLGGPYTISATLLPTSVLDNYEIAYLTADFTITPRPASVAPDGATKVYGDPDPTFTGTLTGFLAADGVSATYSRAAGETVAGGPYAISAVLSPAGVLSNYDISYGTADFTITTRPVSVTPDAASKVYGDSDPALTGTLTNFVAGDGVTASYTRDPGETVADGPYTISAELTPVAVLDNYAITYHTALFTITPKPLDVTMVSDTRNFGDVTPLSFTASYSAFAFGETEAVLGGTLTFTPAASTFTNTTFAGVYPVTPGGLTSSNYAITFHQGTLTILDTTAPIVSGTSATPNPVAVNTAVNLSATISDATTGNSDISGACYTIDGGSCTMMTGAFGTPTVTATATIPGSGIADVFEVCVYGTDAAGNTNAKMDCVLVARYDPSAGFVTGGGWIISPAGAWTGDLALTGKATFGFVAKYLKGKQTPDGNTEFQFHAGGLNFKSTQYEWLVVAGSKAQYKGVGTVNGVAGYGFMLFAIDGGKNPDKFRMKIWRLSDGVVVYDNQMNDPETGDPATLLGGGNIVVHSK